MIRITNGIETIFEGNPEEYETKLKKMMPNPPPPPEPRTLKDIDNTIFGYKLNKVKHLFCMSIYIISLMISFIYMIYSQNASHLLSIWFVINVYVIGLFALIKSFIWLFKNWNKEI